MNKIIQRTLGAVVAAGIAVLSVGATAPANATSYAVGVSKTSSAATVTNTGASVRFDLSLSVWDTGPLVLQVHPRVVLDSTPTQIAVSVSCTPETLPGQGTYEAVCEGATASGQPLPAGEYDLTGQLLVTRAADGTVLGDTTLTHRLVVDAPAAEPAPEPAPEPEPDVRETVKCQHEATVYRKSPERPVLAAVVVSEWGHKVGTTGIACGDKYNLPRSPFAVLSSKGHSATLLSTLTQRKGAKPGAYKVRVVTTYTNCVTVNGLLESCGKPQIEAAHAAAAVLDAPAKRDPNGGDTSGEGPTNNQPTGDSGDTPTVPFIDAGAGFAPNAPNAANTAAVGGHGVGVGFALAGAAFLFSLLRRRPGTR